MYTFILYMLMQTVSGSIAGYITNTYAIKMLFHEYTPLKLGGVIVKTKEQFIEEISSFIEQDIINIEAITKELEKEVFRDHLKNMVDHLFHTVLDSSSQTEESIKQFQGFVSQKRIGDYLQLEEVIQVFLTSKEWEGLLCNLSKAILDMGKGINQTIMDVLPDNFSKAIDHYIEEKMPAVLAQMILWIRYNRDEIENIIEIAIKETIDTIAAEKGGAKGPILMIAKQYIVSSVLSRFGEGGVIENLLTRLESGEDEKSLSNEFSNEVKDYLNHLRIKEILVMLEKANLLTYEKLASFLSSNGKRYSKKISSAVAIWIEKKELKFLDDFDLAAIFREKGKADICLKLEEEPQISFEIALSLQKLLCRHVNKIFSGKIKNIIMLNLHKLKDEELCNLAEDFIGRELKPIAKFGGILGGIVGILSGLIGYHLGGDLFSVTLGSLAFSIPAFAFIGYLTNVIALQMIFRPYKKNPVLAKIPGLRVFSEGYIVQNKEKFASSMSRFVDEGLLDRESINASILRYKDDFKKKTFDFISADDYKRVRAFADKHMDKITRSVLSYMKTPLSDAAGNYLTSDLMLHDVSQLLISLVDRGVTEDTTIGHAFHGKIKEFISENEAFLLDSAVKALQEKLENMVDSVVENVTRTVKRKLNFLESAGYMMMDGDSIVTSIIENIIFDKAPQFLEEKKLEIGSILNHFLEEHVYEAKLSDFLVEGTSQRFSSLAEEFLRRPSIRKRMKNEAQKAIGKMLESISHVPLNQWVRVSSEDLEFVAKWGIDLGFDSVESEFGGMMKDIDFKGITQEEVRHLDARGIHKMFLSFAGKYFRKLETYGLIGGVFGIYPLIGPVAGFFHMLNGWLVRKS